MNTWITLAAVAVGTYALRVSMFIALGRRELPAWTSRPMTLVAPSAVSALVASMLAVDQGSAALAPMPELFAIAAGFVAARRSGNVMHAFTAGLPTFWLLSVLT